MTDECFTCKRPLLIQEEHEEEMCAYCFSDTWGETAWGDDVAPEMIASRKAVEAPTNEELAETYRSLGVDPPPV